MYEIHKRAEGTTTAFRILFVRKVFFCIEDAMSLLYINIGLSRL